MRNAILISLSFHVAAGLIWSLIVEITQVRFVPRQVYTVNIITPAELPKPPPKVESPVVEPAPAPPVKEEEEPIAPPEKPKPKPKPKPPEEKPKAEVKKTVPSTEPPQPEVQPQESPGEESQPATGDISLDGEDFPFAYYITNMRRKIAAHWQVPGGSVEEKFCIVYFKITRSGTIVSPRIETSSGSLVFDQAALRSVVQSSPLPELPPAYDGDELGVHFSFAYENR